MIRERLRAELSRERLRPDVLLAVALSTATRIEAELVREVRLAVLPQLDVGAESDFWFSEWVGARQRQVVALRADLLEPLRARLDLFDEPARAALWAAVERVHVNLSPALALEEQVTWLACTGGEPGLRKARTLLRSASKAMAVELRDGVAGWVIDAMSRLPAKVLQSNDGWHLVLNARKLRSDDISAEPKRTDRKVIEEILIPVAHGGADTAMRRVIGVRWDDGVLVLGEGVEGGITIKLPHHVPPLVELVDNGSEQSRWLSLRKIRYYRPEHPGGVRLRTLDGRVFEIPEAIGGAVHASPVLVQVEGALGEPARFWLQPVRFETGGRARQGQPVALLMKVLDTIPVDPNALTRLHKWLAQGTRSAIRLLHGWTEEHRIRLATQIAAESEQHGWHVYRGRQDPAAAQWLRADKPQPGSSGVLLVVDRADSWHPQHLLGMLSALLDDETPTRVLLLSPGTGHWWNAITRSFEESGVDLGVQKLLPEQPHRTSADLFTAIVDVVADATGEDLSSLRARDRDRDEDVELTAVAAALDVLKGPAGKNGAAKVVLRHEHLYREERESAHATQLAALVLLATLLRPLHVGVARELSLHFGLIESEDDWRPLLAAYERLYPLDQDALDPLGRCQLADHLLAGVLVDRDADLGVDPGWARGLVSSIAAGTFPAEDPDVAKAEAHALTALGHAATRFAKIATDHLKPLVRARPGLLAAAGAPTILSVVGHADTDLLDVISHALRDEPDVRLAPAIAELEGLLVRRRLRQADAGPGRDAPLFLRLAHSQARAGLPEAALASAERATTEYRRLVLTEPRVHTPNLCEALILQSELLGELDFPAQALTVAEDAEARLRKLQLRQWARPNANLGSALANLGRQKARAGNAPNALQDVLQAVRILRSLAATQSAEYSPELAEALVNLAERAAEAQRADIALAAAEEAVELAEELYRKNKWAHIHRYAAARARLGSLLPDALPQVGQAVELYRRAAQASSERFEPHLAATLVQYARAARDAGHPATAIDALTEAIALWERRERPADLAVAVALRDQWADDSA